MPLRGNYSPSGERYALTGAICFRNAIYYFIVRYTAKAVLRKAKAFLVRSEELGVVDK